MLMVWSENNRDQLSIIILKIIDKIGQVIQPALVLDIDLTTSFENLPDYCLI